MTQIYVCYHKALPFVKSDVLTPIQVGAEIAENQLDIIKDNTGDHISAKNPYFCELTATYWIWKNAKADNVGLCHYRRFFNFKNHETKVFRKTDQIAEKFSLNEKTVSQILKEYDLILPMKKGSKRHPKTLYDFYAKEHFQSDLDLTLDIIKEKHPNQYPIADHVLRQWTYGYYANMIVAKKEVFDAYASWLFGILFELERRIQKDVVLRSSYQQRVYGFISERLMPVFVATHPLFKVKEVPCVFVENSLKKYLKYQVNSPTS